MKLFVVACTTLLASCAAVEVSPIGPEHPASPTAESAVVPPGPGILDPNRVEAIPEQDREETQHEHHH